MLGPDHPSCPTTASSLWLPPTHPTQSAAEKTWFLDRLNQHFHHFQHGDSRIDQRVGLCEIGRCESLFVYCCTANTFRTWRQTASLQCSVPHWRKRVCRTGSRNSCCMSGVWLILAALSDESETVEIFHIWKILYHITHFHCPMSI